MKGKIYNLGFRRKRKGKTDYRKRLKVLLANKPRLIIRKSVNNITAQVAEYHDKGDKVVVSSDSKMLKRFGWKVNSGNLPSAYLVGVLLGGLAKKKGVNEMVLDIGRNRSVKGSRIYAVLKGVCEIGIKVPHSEDVLPDDDRIYGKHIIEYAKKSGDDTKLFSEYRKNKLDMAKLTEHIQETKKRILSEGAAK